MNGSGSNDWQRRRVRPRRRNVIAASAVVPALILAAGCRTGLVDLRPRKISIRRFDLGKPVTSEKPSARTGLTAKVLAVEPFGTIAPLSREFVIREGQGSAEVVPVTGAVWRDRPELLVSAFVLERLSVAHVFRAVTPVGVGPDPDLILSGVLQRFEWERSEKGLRACLRLSVQVRQADLAAGAGSAGRRALFSTLIDVEAPADSAAPEDLAGAMHRCVQQACGVLLERLAAWKPAPVHATEGE